MRIKKKTIVNLCIMVILICCFEPEIFVKIRFVHQCVQLIIISSFLYYFLRWFKRVKSSKFLLIITLFGVWLNIGEIVNNGMFYLSTIRFSISLSLLCFFYELYSCERIERLLFKVCFMMSFLNLICYFIAGNLILSITENTAWLLIGDHALITYSLFSMCIALKKIDDKEYKIKSIFLIVITITTSFFAAATTARVILIFVLIFWILKKQKYLFSHFINKNSVIVITMIVFIFTVLTQSISYIGFVKDFIENILVKDVTFTSRSYIWLTVMDMIHKSPIIGHGYLESIYTPTSQYGFYALHAHNQYLQQFLHGGIIQFSLFILIIYLVIKAADEFEDGWAICSVFGLLILFIFEYYSTSSIFGLLIMVYYSGTANKLKNMINSLVESTQGA